MPIFTSQKYCDVIIQSLKFCKETKGLKVYAFVIMGNHFHLIASAPELSNTLASLKKFTAKEIFILLKQDNKEWLLSQIAFYKKKHKNESDYQVWQEGIHPQWILNNDILIQKIEYIHCNPVRRGLVDDPGHWRYSSFGITVQMIIRLFVLMNCRYDKFLETEFLDQCISKQSLETSHLENKTCFKKHA